MNKKTLLQLLLLLICLSIVLIFYFTYFYKQPEKNKLIENKNPVSNQNLTIVVVGDRAIVERELQDLDCPLVPIDAHGNLIE